MTELTHFDDQGHARMVDVGEKAATERVAVARGAVLLQPATRDLIAAGQAAKGDVLGVARIAGIMAAKRTHELIPLCHPLLLTSITVELTLADTPPRVEITATVKTTGQTGVEMEALTAVSAAALTVYDMVKAVDRGMTITDVQLVHKRGGRSGVFDRPPRDGVG
ncbi:MAG: cyclic pyranopterin monophosphate synthase MoaC [Chloroflexi bacterium]|nr:cyclic pyranopterin monophosphate synthase MoaC [Chloroflexota bacterium]